MSVLVLMYHGVEQRPGPLFVEPRLFAEQVAAIAESGLPVLTVGEVGDRLRDGTLPPLAIALTFDDGFASVVEEAAPVLLERGLRATVFCVAGRLGGLNDWPTNPPGAPRVALAPAADLSRLAAAGFEIGGHGMHHAPLDSRDPDRIRSEVVEGRMILEQAVGAPVRSFAYPYGTGPTPEARQAVAMAYVNACTTRAGHVRSGSDPLALQRVDACYLRSPELFARAVHGGAGAYINLRGVVSHARRAIRRSYSR